MTLRKQVLGIVDELIDELQEELTELTNLEEKDKRLTMHEWERFRYLPNRLAELNEFKEEWSNEKMDG